jgi:hypothetical protein
MCDKNPLSLLPLACSLTGRMINSYREAVVLLYSSNTFDLTYDGDLSFKSFRSLIGERNLAHITSLQLKFRVLYVPHKAPGHFIWRDSWGTLAQMPRLRDLVVHIRADHLALDLKSRNAWLDPIREFMEGSAVKRVSLFIPRSCVMFFRDAEGMGIFVPGWGERDVNSRRQDGLAGCGIVRGQ